MTTQLPIIAPGEIREIAGSREVTFERTGITGRKSFQCRWEDQAALPHVGDAFGGDTVGALLKCIRLTVTGIGKTGTETGDNVSYEYAYAECEYSTDQSTGDELQATLDFTTQAWSAVVGRAWVTGGFPVEDEYPTTEPILRYSITKVCASFPIVMIMNTVGKINSDTIWGFAPNLLLFEGASATSEYDPIGAPRWRVTYNFVGKTSSHNRFWRKPVYLEYPLGEGKVGLYQNTDAGITETYTADADLVGSKIIVKAADWDTMNPAVYGEANFAAVFG